ncbi:50S ribosomal protein L11 methyltransferase [Bordetella genomosp. 8]|uniref:Ribosomal protein L11 methyltransferase n=1 Tax=Bordetella genomosp. 8 TaxID=1416806 RepID=A0A1W6YRJ7_9BORD|nr:50S ribosomal protein L11 methyltransferase [Bordetella genomosp. 8]ARP83722.1 50S ribosomal protein L11 methyltransferase [Bordetella genomosp. 8]
MRELVLHSSETQAEALSDALLDAGVLSVSVEDADRDTDAEQPLFGEPGTEPSVQAWERNRVVALLPDGADPAQIIESVGAELGADYAAALAAWSLRDVPDADWVRLTQQQFGPIHIADRIWIVPSWHRDDPEVPGLGRQEEQGGDIHIELDPGLAFGTGSHPTTHLCLAWLEAQLPAGATVLDYGCGSGILAIAARKLGAGRTWAVDIDEQAVIATRENARVNRVELQAMLPDELGDGASDVVVANILSNPLKVLAPMLCGRVAAGGALVLSGVLARQAEEVCAVYARWLPMSVWRERDGWVCLHGRKA